MAQNQGQEEQPMSADPIRVLFICTGNSARSQMAEALMRVIGGFDFEAFSAGTEPKGVNPYTVRVLDQACIDWSEARSKPLAEFSGQPFDYVITVCDRARQACPYFPGAKQMLHWDLEDPADIQGTDEVKEAAFRTTRDLIAEKVRAFVAEARPLPGPLPSGV
jgi:arsenate reductase (thioredoxin)